MTERPEIILPENLSTAQGLLDVCSFIFLKKLLFKLDSSSGKTKEKKARPKMIFHNFQKMNFILATMREWYVCVGVGGCGCVCGWVLVCVFM